MAGGGSALFKAAPRDWNQRGVRGARWDSGCSVQVQSEIDSRSDTYLPLLFVLSAAGLRERFARQSVAQEPLHCSSQLMMQSQISSEG